MRYEDGRVYVEDVGMSSVDVYVTDFVSLELIDGYWTAELETAPMLVYVFPARLPLMTGA